ncbi:MAG: hypothetical protein RL277_2045 [Planctomycetota bacterium]|jgi:uncharacterized protein (DUF697 family)/tellurite resistance protein
MNPRELEALTALCVMAAMADGSKHESERARIQSIFEGLGRSEDARMLASAYGRVMLKQTSLSQEALALESGESRILAYEMAVAVCDADGACTPQEKQFLAELQKALGILPAQASELNARADAVAEAGLPPPLPTAVASGASGSAAPRVAGTAAGLGGAGAGGPGASAGAALAGRDAETDSSILKYSILNGGLELLPQGIATMAIIPLQMKMVYEIGKRHGYTLDRGHVKELIATVGVGMTSQVVENFARNLLGGLAKKYLGKGAGKLVGTATGAMMSFATTYALGQVAKQYYAGGRTLSNVDLKSIFTREVERAKNLYPQHQSAIETSARNTDVGSLLATVRGS